MFILLIASRLMLRRRDVEIEWKIDRKKEIEEKELVLGMQGTGCFVRADRRYAEESGMAANISGSILFIHLC